MQSWIVFAIVIAIQAQQLPAAPEPKATPPPFKVPANASPTHAPVQDVQKDEAAKNDKADDDSTNLGVSKEILRGPEGFVFKDFLKNRLHPTVRRHWEDLMPEEAKERRMATVGVSKNGKVGTVPLVKKGKTGTVRVTFTLHKDGTFTDILVDESSGDRLLDEAAMKAVKDSQPLPPPAAITKDKIKITATFIYNPKHR